MPNTSWTEPNLKKCPTKPPKKILKKKSNKKVTFIETATFFHYDPEEPLAKRSKYDTDEKPAKRTQHTNNQIHITNHCTSINNTLPFTTAILGARGRNELTVEALIDSGCTASVIRQDVFERIPNYQKYITEKSVKLQVHTASHSTEEIITRANIPIHLRDKKGHHHTFPWTFVVLKHLTHQLYLGYDLMSSDRIASFTKNYINLVEPMKKGKLVQIPTHSQSCKTATTLYTMDTMTIQPHSLRTITAYTLKPMPQIQTLMIEDIEDDNDQQSYFNIVPSFQQKTEGDIYQVHIDNTSDNNLTFDANTPIANITSNIPNVFSIQHISVSGGPPPSNMESIQDVLKQNFEMVQPCHNHNKLNHQHHNRATKICNISMNREPNVQTNGKYIISETPKPLKVDMDQARHERAHDQAVKALKQMDHLTHTEKQELLEDFDTKGAMALSPSYLMEKHHTLVEMTSTNDTPVTDEELITQIDIKHLSPEHQQLTKDIFQENIKVLARHEWDIPANSHIVADIELKEEATQQCTNCKYYPLNPQIREEVDKVLEQMIKYGILERTTKPSPIISNLLCVKKKTGKPRIILDSRIINSNVKKIPCPISHINTVFTHFSGKDWITSLDVSNAYFSIPIKRQKIPLFSFYNARKQRLAYTRLAQGFINSGYFLEMLMAKVLANHPDAWSYCDDVFLATSGTLEEHLMALDKLLQSMIEAQLKIKPSKINIATETLEILGHVYHKGKFSIPDAKSQAIQDFRRPTTSKQAKSFVCTTGFYRNYIPRFADITLPIHALTLQDHRKFKWTETAEKAFQKIKHLIKHAMNIYPPMLDRPFQCASDASNTASAFILWQVDDEGNHRFLGCASRIFAKVERGYSTFKKEVLAVSMGLSTYDYILRFADEICLHIDAKAILWLRSVKGSDFMLQRLAITLSTYNIKIKHIRGKDHVLPDALSRSRDYTTTDLAPMSTEEATQLLEQFTIPDTFEIDIPLLKRFLTDDGLPSTKIQKPKKKYTKSIITNTTFKPQMKYTRKIKMPRTSPHHPFYKTQHRDIQQQGLGHLYEDQYMDEQTETYPEQTEENITYAHQQTYPELNVDNLHLTELCDTDTIALNTKLLTDGEITLDTYREAQDMDDWTAPIKAQRPIPKDYVLRQNILIRKLKNQERLALPYNLIRPLFNALHYAIPSRHQPKTKILNILKEKYFNPNLDTIITELCQRCFLCTSQKYNTSKWRKFGEKTRPTRPRQEWAFDFVTGLPNSNGYKYIGLFTDTFSLYPVCAAMKSRYTDEFIKVLQERIITPFGIPKKIYSDREGALISKQMTDLAQDLEIEMATTAADSPFSNSASERHVALVKEGLRILTRQTDETWSELLPQFNQAMMTRRLSTGYTPEEIMFGDKTHENDLLTEITLTATPEEYMNTLRQQVAQIYETHQQRRKIQNDQKRDYVNKTRQDKIFKEDQVVLARNYQHAEDSGGALLSKQQGPYVILQINPNKYTCKIRNLETGHERTANLQHLKHVYPPDPNAPVPSHNVCTNLLKGTAVYHTRSGTIADTDESSQQPAQQQIDETQVIDPDSDSITFIPETQEYQEQPRLEQQGEQAPLASPTQYTEDNQIQATTEEDRPPDQIQIPQITPQPSAMDDMSQDSDIIPATQPENQTNAPASIRDTQSTQTHSQRTTKPPQHYGYDHDDYNYRKKKTKDQSMQHIDIQQQKTKPDETIKLQMLQTVTEFMKAILDITMLAQAI